MAHAVKELCSKFIFELQHLVRKSGLRNMLSIRSAGKTAAFGNGSKISDLMYFQFTPRELDFQDSKLAVSFMYIVYEWDQADR